MKDYIKIDEWRIIEEGFDPHLNKVSESIFSLGNGRMGQRANFEEQYSGPSLQGNYVAGVYYPDKTRVGWWKNGYPDYFAKVLNAANWIGIGVEIDGTEIDLAKLPVEDFRRELNMREGYLLRTCTVVLEEGRKLKIEAKRFCSIVDDEVGAIRYAITPLGFSGKATLTPYIDFDVKNQDANYDEKFWEEVSREMEDQAAYVTARTRKTGFDVCTGMTFALTQAGTTVTPRTIPIESEKYTAHIFTVSILDGEETVLTKFAANISSENHDRSLLQEVCQRAVEQAHTKGFDKMLEEQAAAWAAKWAESDIIIEGDAAAQQAIRFNIFQLNQTYTGEDPRLNIGPKGFTGEKYGGSTYWDTEAYCLPFYLATADPQVGRNLLLYRYKQLGKAIENAQKLGFTDGAALYPMVTMNGEECHNEWEITFEEVHRNGAIAHAIYDYVRYTGDESYLADYGVDVLVAISRFWAQRVNFSEEKGQYVMLGVTGPNEYENNINNNWYTSTIALWTLNYTLEVLEKIKAENPARYAVLDMELGLDETREFGTWRAIIGNMFLPEDPKRGIKLQQEGYLDKEQILVKDLPASERPLNQKWSWDRILRSCFIKQADVLQGMFLLEDQFDIDTIRRNFEFYEPRTVHESSLSPCVHAVLAARLGMEEKAYEMYLRTARLDLDDYNNDTEDGCHTTSMAGTWMAVVQGFGGMRVRDGQLHFRPMLPAKWSGFSFRIRFRGAVVKVHVGRDGVHIEADKPLTVFVNDEPVAVGQTSVTELVS
ncbi:glycoside hydrolase family 65 protein [Hymenobacter sp. BT18]|uniref:glycoside hydrolase family 65 protein n=1 Tax=Hymenobacter sp. BT18 TaxID=2835648 RepID=UPI00143E9423|nr:glycoside hydrolase family 65 protein [Hymenobacter sp. BT18]QIX61630.1 glycoside hydrolase family 65 protein [Hymenobacter sp. BT18]